jgi:hypothetical protein
MEFRLTADDYNFLLRTIDLSPGPEFALRAGVVEGMVLRFEIPLEVGSDLLVDMMNAAVAVTDRRRRGVLERLVRKLTEELDRQGMEFELDPVRLIRRQGSYNRSPQAELGGFSPLEVHQLLAHDWRPGSPGLQLSDDVPPDLLAGSDILTNARIFLNSLDPNGARATPAGNLNRRFVSDMLASMRWTDGFIEDLLSDKKVINEQDAWPLHDLRLVLQLAKLIVRRKGVFTLTRLGRSMIHEEQAGAFFALLFETTFRTLNLAYHDRLPEIPDFQGTIAYPLAVLAREAEGWLAYAPLVPRLLLPSLAETLPRHELFDCQECLVRVRLLERLWRFGLVELNWEEQGEWCVRKIEKVRRTPLYNMLLNLELG